MHKTLATVLVLSMCLPSFAQTLPQVISVGDGDTIKVNNQGKAMIVRLGCIDAPETAQNPWGQQSAARLKQLLPKGQPVRIRTIERDRYGRTVAEVFLGNLSINLLMVREGHAVVYRQYLNGCASTKDQYLQAEAQAKQKRLAFWNQRTPVMPWDFRRAKGSNNSTPSVRATPIQPQNSQSSNCDPAYPGVCIPSAPPDLDCGDISYRRFQVLSPDPHGFDRDGDGIGCER